MRQHQDKSQAIFEAWEIFLRYRWHFIFPAFAVMVTVLTVSLFLPRKYKAVAGFERRTDLVLTEVANRGMVQNYQNPRQTLTDEVAGGAAINELLENIGPLLISEGIVDTESDLEQLHTEISRRVIVFKQVTSRQLDRITVEFISSDPRLSQIVVNRLVEGYIRRTRQTFESRLSESREFFEAEVIRNREIIGELENELLAFEITNAELLPNDPNGVGQKMQDAKARLEDFQADERTVEAQIIALQQTITETPAQLPTVVRGKNPEISRLENKRQKLSDLLAEFIGIQKMTEKHPDVMVLQNQIASITSHIETLPQEVVTQTQLVSNPAMMELSLRLNAAQARLTGIQEDIASTERHMARIDVSAAEVFPARSQFRKLERNLTRAQRQLSFWEENLREVEMTFAVENGERGIRLNFIQPAPLPKRPVSPMISQVIMGSFGIGIIAGALVMFIRFRTDEAFYDAEVMAKRIDLPLFGAVSELITQRHRKLRHFRRMIAYPTTGLVMATILGGISMLLYTDLKDPSQLKPIKEAILQKSDADGLILDETDMIEPVDAVTQPRAEVVEPLITIATTALISETGATQSTPTNRLTPEDELRDHLRSRTIIINPHQQGVQ